MAETTEQLGLPEVTSDSLGQAEEPEARHRKALAVARRCAARLREEFSAHRIYLSGSLITGEFGADSDIDLAVEGIGFRPYLRAVAELSFAEGFGIDVINLDFCKPRVREQMELEGEVLA